MAKQQVKELLPDLRKQSRPKRTRAPIFTLHERAIDTGISDLAENYKSYLYGGEPEKGKNA
jgi:hypothetical protein